MKTFPTLLEAAEYAATLCGYWFFADTDESYDSPGLLTTAQTHDEENPLDEDGFYVVSPGGAIGMTEDEGETLEWLFIPDGSREQLPERMPAANTATAEAKFCISCGRPLPPGARFCTQCGSKVL
ncbi:MAG: zinc ribbon domain-containing protein [Ruminococcaceae bacterium]|jgi:ribosomal protein L40E|nr:zinc ribbon domain-containing protein [Oscillospiraceae bacterium]